MTASLSEARMSETFQHVIRSQSVQTILPDFSHVSMEVPCVQGRPDFVASTTHHISSAQDSRILAQALATKSKARILSWLSHEEPRSEISLSELTGLSHSGTKRIVRELAALGIVEDLGHTQYVLSHSSPSLSWNLWAFELKVHHWQRAFFQACQYQAFAQHSAVVLPEQWLHRAENQLGRFLALGIGLYSLDVNAASIRCILAPRKVVPASRWHYLYALGKFLSSEQYVASMHRRSQQSCVQRCFTATYMSC